MQYLDIKNRLRKVLSKAGVSKNDLARDLGKSTRTINRYLSPGNEVFFSIQAFATLCDQYNINASYVLFDRGPMFRDATEASLDEARELVRAGLDLLDQL